MRGNVLFIVIDQLRADCLHGALAAHVPTPNLDRLAAEGVAFHNHFTVAAPCGPSRASLLTGLYASRHGAVRNGVPLRPGLTNVALEARQLGYEPLLFGYTDSQPDPATHHPNDPDLLSYEGVLAGFRELVEMRQEHGFEWPGYLRAKGYPVEVPLDHASLYRPKDGKLGGPALYSAEDSDTAYLTDRTLAALDIRRGGRPWFAHVTYIRPHPPLVAPAPYHALVDPAALPPPAADRPQHPLFDAWFSGPARSNLFWGYDGYAANLTSEQVAVLRATYLGLVAEVDHHIGRLLDWLDDTGQADDTLVIVTADHAEMLGDWGLWGKDCPLPPAFHIPLLIRAPGMQAGAAVTALTESVDVTPTLLEWLGGPVPGGLDGHSLLPMLRGEHPADWRKQVRMEISLFNPDVPTRFERSLGLPGLRAEAVFDGQHLSARFLKADSGDGAAPGKDALPPLEFGSK